MEKTEWMEGRDSSPIEHTQALSDLEQYESDLVHVLRELEVKDGYREHLLVELAKTRKEIRERGKGGPHV